MRSDDLGASPLPNAILGNGNELVQFLIPNGADLMARDNLGHTPLNMAALRRNLVAAEKLLEAVRDHFPRDLERYVNEVR
jgi:ankyrin repeat protein